MLTMSLTEVVRECIMRCNSADRNLHVWCTRWKQNGKFAWHTMEELHSALNVLRLLLPDMRDMDGFEIATTTMESCLDLVNLLKQQMQEGSKTLEDGLQESRQRIVDILLIILQSRVATTLADSD